MTYFKENKNTLTLTIRVVPRSSKSEIIGIYNDSLKIKLKAPPVDNAANDELIRFLREKLNIRKSNIEIKSGHKQNKKIVSVSGCDIKTISSLLQQTPLWQA